MRSTGGAHAERNQGCCCCCRRSRISPIIIYRTLRWETSLPSQRLRRRLKLQPQIASVEFQRRRDSVRLSNATVVRCNLPAAQNIHIYRVSKSKGSPYSTTERRVPELIPVLGSQPAGDVSHKPGGRLPLLSARPAVTPATLKRAATDFAA